jgi:hypothetical protein
MRMKPLSQSELLHGMTSEDSHAVLKQASMEKWREGQFLFSRGRPGTKVFPAGAGACSASSSHGGR